MDYEPKWHPVIKDEDNEILQYGYRLAKHFRKVLNLDRPERLNPEDLIYVCLECKDNSTSFLEVFRTQSKKEAQEWVDRKSFCRTWHEKIKTSDSPNLAVMQGDTQK